MTNVEALTQLQDWLRTNPHEHNQTVWYMDAGCGTSYCAAGYVATVMLGKRPIPEWDGFSGSVELGDGRERSIRWVAAEHLGLSEGQAKTLFDAGNGLEFLIEYIDELIDEESKVGHE